MLKIMLVASSLMGASPAFARIDCSSEYKSWADAIRASDSSSAAAPAATLAKVKTCEESRFNDTNNCQAAVTDFKETVKKFSDKCGENKLPSTPQTGTIACSAAVNKCNCIDKRSTPKEKQDMHCPESIPASETKHCGSIKEGDADRIAKKIEKAEDRLKEARDKVNKLDDDKEKSEGGITDKLKEARRAKTAARAAYDQAVAEAKSAASASQKEMYASMNSLREKIFAVQQQLTESKEKDAAAYSALQEQKVKIELACSSQATAAINAMTTEATANLRNGTYNRGSQNDIFRQVGMTDRQSWQQQAGIRKRWCMESEPTKESQNSANRAYQDTLRSNASNRQTAYDQISMLNGQMSQLQNPNGSCVAAAGNGAAMQTQACKDASEVQGKIDAAAKTKKAAEREAEQDKADAFTSTQKQASSKGRQNITATEELEKAEAELKALRDKESLLDSYANSPNPEAARALDISMDELVDRAGGLNHCCNYNNVGSGNGSLCEQARGFLKDQGYSIQLLRPPGSGPSATAPVTPPSPATPPTTNPANPNTGTGAGA